MSTSRLRVGSKADDFALQKCTVTKSKRLKPGSNMTGFFKEVYGSKRGVLPMMMMNDKSCDKYG